MKLPTVRMGYSIAIPQGKVLNLNLEYSARNLLIFLPIQVNVFKDLQPQPDFEFLKAIMATNEFSERLPWNAFLSS